MFYAAFGGGGIGHMYELAGGIYDRYAFGVRGYEFTTSQYQLKVRRTIFTSRKLVHTVITTIAERSISLHYNLMTDSLESRVSRDGLR